MPKQKRTVPFATPGRNRSFCSWFPQLTIGGTPMPLPAPRPHITPLYPFIYIRTYHRGIYLGERTTRAISSVRTREWKLSHSFRGISPGSRTSSPVDRARYPNSACRFQACNPDQFPSIPPRRTGFWLTQSGTFPAVSHSNAFGMISSSIYFLTAALNLR